MKGWIIGGGVAVVAVGAGAATWAAVSFLSSGPQAADAFPSNTLAIVSVDLDPGASQKIAAFKLANKLPSLKDDLGLHSGDDLRRKLVDSLVEESGCDLDYAGDVEPWIGSTAGIGLVGATDPQPMMALAVTDEAKARKGAKVLLDCVAADAEAVGEKAPSLGFAVGDGWLVVASDNAEATRLLAASKKGPLSESDDYQRWTEAAGDPGIVTAYAAPGSMEPLFKDLTGAMGSESSVTVEDDLGDLEGLGDLGLGATSWCPGLTDAGAATDSSALGDFGGAAATLRFSSSGLEFELAQSSEAGKGATTHAADVTTLPDDVGAAIGIGFGDGWVDSLMTGLKETCGDAFDPSALYAMVGAFTGLDLPADLETLTQQSTQLALGPDLDVESLINSASPDDSLPLALRIMGDPDELTPVVDKLGTLLPGSSFVQPQAGKDSVTLGFSEEWKKTVAAGGDLGENSTFKAVVPHASDAGVVLYLDVATIRDGLTSLLEGSGVEDDLSALDALGASFWAEDGTGHGRITLRVE